jgi:formylglycine-generating enzyme required for sulfatase activity
MRVIAAWIICLGLFSLCPSHAEQRFALLIANDDYPKGIGEPLKNPRIDVKLIQESLEKIGFKVTIKENLKRDDTVTAIRAYRRGMEEAIAEAKAKKALQGNGNGEPDPSPISFFYYSGHGAADSNTHANYLIPIDVTTTGDTSLWDRSIRQEDVIRELTDGGSKVRHVLVFDACRNELNLPKPAEKGVGGEKGFDGVPQHGGMLIAYATAPNQTAKDTGQYAMILAEQLGQPGVEIVQLFRNVQLIGLAKMHQRPFFIPGIDEETFLAAAPEGKDCNGVAITVGAEMTCRIPGDGQQFKDCRACPNMVLIPPGQINFRGPLGWWDSVRQIFKSEDLRPRYEVSFAEARAVSPFSITVDDWQACVAGGGCETNQSEDGGRDHPVVTVSWNDAMKYAAWLKDQTGQDYRLLSEAELEYLKGKSADPSQSCRNCDRITVRIDKTWVPDYNAKGGSGGHMESRETLVPEPRDRTLPVLAFVPNNWGLYAIKDNANDLLADCWTEEIFQVIPRDGSALIKGKCETHTVVGTHLFDKFWDTFWRGPYIEYRWAAKPEVQESFTSFRVARALKPCEFEPKGCSSRRDVLTNGSSSDK